MKKTLFKGCGTAIATPFDENGVNISEFTKLLSFQLENNADAIIVCGTTGEASTMTSEEKLLTIQSAVQTINHKIPVIAGVGSNSTKQVIENIKLAESIGVDGLLVVTPYYNKCTQKGLFYHYQEIAKNTTLPIILYNVPNRTGVNIEPQTCLELSKLPNIVAIKEASGNLSQIAEIAHLCGDNLDIYSGNDDQILPILSLGGIGVISVLSNVLPKYTHNMVEYFMSGQISKACQFQLDSLPLINALFSEVNPIPVKCALNLMGFDFGVPRLPLTPMSAEKEFLLKNALFSLLENSSV